jgi:hypothetical protein
LIKPPASAQLFYIYGFFLVLLRRLAGFVALRACSGGSCNIFAPGLDRCMTLRVVPPGERTPRKRPQTVTQAARGNSHRDLLAALRDRIAAAVQDPTTPAVALAALSRQLTLISRELTVLDAVDSPDAVTVAAATADEPWSAV